MNHVTEQYAPEEVFEEDASATPDETLEYLAKRSGRRHIPLSRAFLRRPKPRRPGPFQQFVTGRKTRAFDVYGLIHGVASSEPYDVALPAMVYGRALALPETASTETSVRNAISFLEEVKLVRTRRDGRLRRVTLLRDDGTGLPYTGPVGGAHGYFRIPWEYYTERWNDQLKLPGRAALVIALSQGPAFTLPAEHAAKWYGISADTIARGFKELEDLGLLRKWQTSKRTPAARYGVAKVNHYALTGPFARSPKADADGDGHGDGDGDEERA
jgi:hypothetical protein